MVSIEFFRELLFRVSGHISGADAKASFFSDDDGPGNWRRVSDLAAGSAVGAGRRMTARI